MNSKFKRGQLVYSEPVLNWWIFTEGSMEDITSAVMKHQSWFYGNVSKEITDGNEKAISMGNGYVVSAHYGGMTGKYFVIRTDLTEKKTYIKFADEEPDWCNHCRASVNADEIMEYSAEKMCVDLPESYQNSPDGWECPECGGWNKV